MLEERLDQTQWRTCLELGCGDGSLLSALENRGYFDSKSVVAIDVSQERINIVKAALKQPECRPDRPVDCVIGDACGIAIKDRSIDFVITSQVSSGQRHE